MHACVHLYLHIYIHTSIHCITLHVITLHYIKVQHSTVHCKDYITLRFITLHCIALHYITLPYLTLHTLHAYMHTCIDAYIHAYGGTPTIAKLGICWQGLQISEYRSKAEWHSIRTSTQSLNTTFMMHEYYPSLLTYKHQKWPNFRSIFHSIMERLGEISGDGKSQ